MQDSNSNLNMRSSQVESTRHHKMSQDDITDKN